MEVIRYINYSIAVIFFLCFLYQFYYLLVPHIIKDKSPKNSILKKYAVIISARNEELVIGQLIGSINNQTYPKELVDVFVIADNCTDRTAEVAEQSGATVFVRNNKEKVGKGFALEYIFNIFLADKEKYNYDGFFVFDADNILEVDYIEQMNKTFTPENKIITSYRNSKNFGTNWITAGYSLWFIRESQYLNRSRMRLGKSCAISGTGFMFSREIIEETNGWKHFLLTEDIEFTVDNVLNGNKVAYCEDAMLYDEQPTKMSQSVRQRLRWAKGYIQICRKYGLKLVKKTLTFKSFSCYDMTMSVIPGIVLTILATALNLIALFYSIFTGGKSIDVLLGSFIGGFLGTYIVLFVMGLITTINERKQIHCTGIKKILYLFTFPLFQMTYIPISLVALFKKVEWKPIQHTESKNLSDLRG